MRHFSDSYLFSADKADVTMADSIRTFNLFPAAIVLLAALVLRLRLRNRTGLVYWGAQIGGKKWKAKT
jgi:hypothetical protein